MLKYIALAASALSLSATAQEAIELTPPVCLQPNINFWHDVYTKYTRHDIIVYNQKTMEVYNVYPRPKGSKKTIKKYKRHLLHKYVKLMPKEKKNIAVKTGARGFFERGFERMHEHYPKIVKKLEQQGMPHQIAFLPFVESSYSYKATSPVGAVGMWQIMPATGRLFGIKKRARLRDNKVATDVAIKLLKFNYEMLGDWTLAINAYHSGTGRLLKASNMANSKNICEILNYLDENDVTIKGYKFYSRNYVAQLFAIDKAVTERLNPHVEDEAEEIEEGVQNEFEEKAGDATGFEESDREDTAP
jgi:membrane-bound lytic murein transglycosylase MltF